MANPTTPAKITDGDVPSDGYFNGFQSFVLTNQILNALSESSAQEGVLDHYYEFLMAIDTGISSKTEGGIIASSTCFISKLIDDFGDASIDATKWTTTGSTGESGGGIGIAYSSADANATNTWTNNGASGINAKTLTGDTEFYIRLGYYVERMNNGSGHGSRFQLMISDGSTHVALIDQNYTSGATSNASFEGIVIIYIDKTNSNAYYSTDGGTTWSGATSISALTAWYVRGYLEITRGGGSGTFVSPSAWFYDLGYLNAANSGSTGVVTFTSKTTQASTDTMILAPASTSGTVQWAFSVDGSNWNNATAKALTKAAQTGATMQTRITGTFPASLALANKPHAPRTTKFGVLWL